MQPTRYVKETPNYLLWSFANKGGVIRSDLRSSTSRTKTQNLQYTKHSHLYKRITNALLVFKIEYFDIGIQYYYIY